MTKIFDINYEALIELNREKCRQMRNGEITKEEYARWQSDKAKGFWECVEMLDQEKNERPQEEQFITEEEHIFRRGYHHGFCAARSRSDVTVEQVHAWRHSEQKPLWPPGSPMERREA